MKEFGTWMGSYKTPKGLHEQNLSESGTAWRSDDDGLWYCECCACGNVFELPVDTMEIAVGQKHYCGGSPRCCP